MPAIDQFQPTVIRALENDGWHVEKAPFTIRIDKRTVFIDLKAEREQDTNAQEIIIIEVKSFEGKSAVRDLEDAIGQFLSYQALLEEVGLEYPLYLAVPNSALAGILSERLAQIIVRRLKIKLIVVDEVEERIIQWID